ncbi:MAG: TIGR02206 family membrane protein, partial [Clostridia bacterium]|nr:TIGR02206 family membrane protein [Clostridia bacterium]
YVLLGVLAVIAYAANVMIGPGANYLYMARPEDTPSILDFLPPVFAVRALVMAAVITLLFFLSYLPWLIKDRRAKKQKTA